MADNADNMIVHIFSEKHLPNQEACVEFMDSPVSELSRAAMTMVGTPTIMPSSNSNVL
ncbi:hypothetical protein J6590_043060 [Homalodisca vitripennis]|nr:hypothetical protein J6590_043060 [Homalodisca vitripennis]